jgi:WD40 repeat protein
LQSADPAANFISLRGHEGGITTLAISPDNHWLVTGSLDTKVRLWDLFSTDPNSTSVVLDDYETEVSALAYSSGGRWLVSASKDGAAHIRDWKTFKQSANPITLNGAVSEICCLDFSPDEHWLASGPHAQLWDLNSVNSTTQAILPYMQFGDVSALKFSLDGNWLVLAGYEGMQLTDIEKQDVDGSLSLNGGVESSNSLAFSPDGKTLISGTDNFISFWRFSWDDLYSQACQVAGRNLTRLEWQMYFPGETYRITCPQWPAGQ